MNAKKNLINPPTTGGGSLLDSMNPASRANAFSQQKEVNREGF